MKRKIESKQIIDFSRCGREVIFFRKGERHNYLGSPVITFDEGFAEEYDMIAQVNTKEMDMFG